MGLAIIGLAMGLKAFHSTTITGAAFVPAKANSKILETVRKPLRQKKALQTDMQAHELPQELPQEPARARTCAPGDDTARLTFPIYTGGLVESRSRVSHPCRPVQAKAGENRTDFRPELL